MNRSLGGVEHILESQMNVFGTPRDGLCFKSLDGKTFSYVMPNYLRKPFPAKGLQHFSPTEGIHAYVGLRCSGI